MAGRGLKPTQLTPAVGVGHCEGFEPAPKALGSGWVVGVMDFAAHAINACHTEQRPGTWLEVRALHLVPLSLTHKQRPFEGPGRSCELYAHVLPGARLIPHGGMDIAGEGVGRLVPSRHHRGHGDRHASVDCTVHKLRLVANAHGGGVHPRTPPSLC